MKKIFLAFCFFSFSFFIYSLDFLIAPKISYNTQLITDSIYDGSKLNSRLEWNSYYLFKAGFEASLIIGDLYISNTTMFNIPGKNGLQFDSDWRTQGIKTNYSIGDLYSDFGFDCKLQVKYEFSLPFDFCIYPVVSLDNSYAQLLAKNIYCWCGDVAHTGLEKDYSWDSEYSRRVKKYGIDLYNNITCIFVGAEIKKSFEKIFVDFKACISPYTYIFSVDHHLNKEEGTFYQMVQKAIFKAFDFSLSAGYFFNEKNTINVSTDFSFCPETPGDLYYGYFKIDNIIADETCSFSFSKFSINLSWNYRF